MAEKTRTNDLGFLEGYDDETGEIIWTEKKKTVLKDGAYAKASSPGRGRPRKEDIETHHYVTDGRGEKLYVPKGTNVDHLPKVIWPFSQVTADSICQLITEGKTIKEIGQTEGYPAAHLIHKWARKYPEFKREMKEAIEARATHYFDEVMEIAKTASKDTIMEDRLRSELLKWAAEVGDRSNYGKATKITGDPDAPIAFIIDTGVKPTEHETKDITDQTSIEEKDSADL